MLMNLGHIIARWERSGQGDGGFEPVGSDNEGEMHQPVFGYFVDSPHGALASRGAFLRGKPILGIVLRDKISLQVQSRRLIRVSAAKEEQAVCHLCLAEDERRMTRMPWLLLVKAFVISASTMRWRHGLEQIFPRGKSHERQPQDED